MARDVLILWNEGDWRCEVHTGGFPGEGSFLVYRGDSIVNRRISLPGHGGVLAR